MTHAIWTLRAAFGALGVMFGTWLGLIPWMRDTRALSHDQVGLALLCAGIGGLLTFPLVRHLLARVGSAQLTIVSGISMACCLPVIAVAPNLWWLSASLFAVGIPAAAMDVAINAQAVVQERHMQRSLMARFHACWSVGALLGALGVGLALNWHVPPWTFMALVGLLCACGLWFNSSALLQEDSDVDTPRRAPRLQLKAPVLLVGSMVVGAYMVEGAVSDWSGLFMRDIVGVSLSQAPMAFAAFSFAMVVVRLFGDPVIDALGNVRVLQLSGSLGALGMATSLMAPTVWVVLPAYAVVGCGMALAVPVLMRCAGQIDAGSGGQALATVAFMGTMGMLIAPPLLGWLAHVTSLRSALWLVPLMSAYITLQARRAVHARQ
ncbi:MAG: MFS transporter [Burkholderiales bacterium]